jgi:DegV family protein with EDD domain
LPVLQRQYFEKGEIVSKFIILTESGTDLPLDLVNQHHIQVIPMHVILGNKDCPDGSIQVTDVYEYYNRTGKIPTTSAVNPAEFQFVYKKIKEENPGVIIIHISYSSKASCTHQNAKIAGAGMGDIYLIDSLNVSGGEALIVLKAAELIEQHPDISPADLVAQIEAYILIARASFIPGNLEYLRAGGRVSNAAYLGASLLHIKPLIEIVEGKLISTKKYRGDMRRIAEQYMEEFIDGYAMDRGHICLMYSSGLEGSISQRMEEIAKAKGFRKITWIQTGCVISTHSGPGAIGLAGFESRSCNRE